MQEKLENHLGFQGAFDFKKRIFFIGGRRAVCTFIIGYSDTTHLERIFHSLLHATPQEVIPRDGMGTIQETLIPFPSSEVQKDLKKAADEVLRGSACLLIDGFEEALILDARAFPTRGLEEPEKDRTLRGPHIGLNESLIGNIIQIRRYLRTASFRCERFVLGNEIKNEAAILYLDGSCDKALLDRLRKRLQSCNLPNLSMTQENLANFLFPRKRGSVLNPFPRLRYTERPDVIASTLMEGKIAVICDNSPSVMLIPECIFDFFEETDDYYFPPMIASYLRIVRFFVFLCSVFLIPGWLWLVGRGSSLPDPFHFLTTMGDCSVPLFLQFLIIELAIDGLRMASLNTPNTLSNSFSVIGGLLLGEFAVKSGWFVPQTILYSAFTGIANFIPTNYELGYSFKFMRISLILLVEFFGGWGLLSGTILWGGLLASTRSVAGKGYLYPILPFDPKGLAKILFRTTKGRERQGIRKK